MKIRNVCLALLTSLTCIHIDFTHLHPFCQRNGAGRGCAKIFGRERLGLSPDERDGGDIGDE